ncbi:Vacuolar protein sorting-associated protein 53 [Coemansia sp. RSA 1286]|nr:Vacuolar protein sorting-associated protein 53 [Coemansia sp. RSA 485]KAJ2602932.1 Vacuolar protein sorting-associated protein 53 [Coemansia sp. RSA 1721]KAJ2640033.1 Vacuolar protein sorting-associated protein 53 [Coemansia sp. RSA 1286]
MAQKHSTSSRQQEKAGAAYKQQGLVTTATATSTVAVQDDMDSDRQRIDSMFPDSASLEGIEVVADNMRRRLGSVHETMRTLLRAQSDNNSSNQQQQQSMESTRIAIDDLYQRISEMRAKARTSERTVLDITQDIKALDFAKRNLTQTTTAMRRLQMLIAAVRQLRQLKMQKRWGEAATVVSAITGLSEGFSGYEQVRPVSSLLSSARELQKDTAIQAATFVERGFDTQGLLTGEVGQMRNACECVQAAGAMDRVVGFYCTLQLRAYAAIFQLDDDVSQLENVSRRYAWLRRILQNHAEMHASVFPDSWKVAEQLSRRFAEATRDQLSELLATREKVNADQLLAALADTLAFETQCNKKFGIVANNSDGLTVYEGSGEQAVSFVGGISCAFEPYMAIFVRGEQAKFAALVTQAQSAPVADDDPSLSVLASSTDLLYQFRESLRQCAALSTGQAMYDLAVVFGQSLSSYARNVLIQGLPQTPHLDDLKHVCLVINTADYCASVAAQLESKIIERIDKTYADRVSFAPCRDALLGAINAGIRVLVAAVENMCEPAFGALAQGPWHTLQTVGDQSAYVSMIASAVDAATLSVRRHVSGSRYLRSYCDKLAVRLCEKYSAAIMANRNHQGEISEVGAEQLLLDAQALKSVLLAVPAIGAEEDKKVQPPNTYARIVTQGVGKIEAVLKAILAPSDPPEALADRFLLLFPKAPRDTFQLVLNLKGIRSADHHLYHKSLQRMIQDTNNNAVAASEPSAATYSTPVAKGTLPAYMEHALSASAPLVSQRNERDNKNKNKSDGHGRMPSTASSGMLFANRSSLVGRSESPAVFSPSGTGLKSGAASSGDLPQTLLAARDGRLQQQQRPDPLGITGVGSSASAMSPGASVFSYTAEPRNVPSDGELGGSAADGTNSPVLASLAANATATRSKINENLRKFMSNMRRN